MNDRNRLLTLAIAGLTLGFPATRWAVAQPLPPSTQPAHPHEKHEGNGEKDDEHEEGEKREHKYGETHDHKEGDEHGEHGQRWEHKDAEQEIETAVPMNLIPQVVMDAVKKEVPAGTITEAELEVKKGAIVYGFDVKAGEITYDINISVDGKFISKVVADEAGEKNEADEKGESDEKSEKKD